MGHGACVPERPRNPSQSARRYQLPALPCQRNASSGRGTENFYPSPVFTHAGVSCERCHGPGAAHVAGGAGATVNPARLSPERRDAVCLQCHLEGKVAIERPGRDAYDFQPGESLFDYLRFYVLPGNQSGLRGVSQVEALMQSICKRKSGDAMSCTSCHDPHYEPPAEERVAYYREKCLTCHGGHFAAKHHVNQPDCTHCHMRATASTDVAHTQVTDHRIPRRPESPTELVTEVNSQALRLVPFPDSAERSTTRVTWHWPGRLWRVAAWRLPRGLMPRLG